MDGIQIPTNRLSAAGAIKRWLLLGPFPNRALETPLQDGTDRAGLDTDYLKSIGGESAPDLAKGDFMHRRTPDGVRSRTAVSVVQAQPNDNIDFSVVYPGSQFHVAYGFCLLESDSDRLTYAYFGSKDGAKVWVNGESVHRVWTKKRAVRPWTDAFPVRLRQGTNRILVKVENAGNEWAFVLHLYREADHLPAVRARVLSFALETNRCVCSATGSAPSLLIHTQPRTLVSPIGVRLEVLGEDGRCHTEMRCRTDEEIALSLGRADPGFTTLKASSTDTRLPGIFGYARLYLGDIREARAKLLMRMARLQRYEKTAHDDRNLSWKRLRRGILDFARWWLGPRRHRDTEADLRLLQEFERMADDLEAGRNDLTGYLGRLLPIKFRDSASQPFAPLHYFVYLPEGYGEPGRKWPLLVFLSGAGEVGDDIHRLKRHGPIKRLEGDRGYPLLVVAPQCPEGKDWNGRQPEHLDAFLDDVRSRFSVDPERILVTGLSMGARGAWDWAAVRPHRFAGVVPVCGRLDPTLAPQLSRLPMWIWHGDCDGTVPIYYGDLTIAALREAGSDARYSVIEGEGHDTWDHAYRAPELVDWMLGLRRPPVGGNQPVRGECRHAAEGLEPIGFRDEPMATWCYLNAECNIERFHRTLYLKLIELYGRLRYRHGLVAKRNAEIVFQDLTDAGAGRIRFRVGVPVEGLPEEDGMLGQVRLEAMRCGVAEYRGPVCALPGAFAALLEWMGARGGRSGGVRRMRVRYLNRDLDYLDGLLLLEALEL